MQFIIAQYIGILTTVIALAGIQFKKINHILISQCLTNFLSAVSFALLGGLSGAWICLVAIAQTLILFRINQKHGTGRIRVLWACIFCLIYIAGTALLYHGWGDLVSGTCAVIFALAVVQEEPARFRGLFLINGLLWMLYDLTASAYTNMLLHGLSVLSTLIAMYRFRRSAAAPQ